MKKINKKYFVWAFPSLVYGQIALAQFQQTVPESEVDLPAASVLNDILHYTNVGLALVFILSVLLLISSGVYFITAGGDEFVLDDAHNLWRVAVIGLVVALIGYIIINLIKYFI
jgi:hypothetical protein